MAGKINVCVPLENFTVHQGSIITFHHEEDKKKYQCTVCKIIFSYESQLEWYGNTHTDNKPFKCPSKTCPKFVEGFKSQQGLNRHMEIHSGKMIKCDVPGCPRVSPLATIYVILRI